MKICSFLRYLSLLSLLYLPTELLAAVDDGQKNEQQNCSAIEESPWTLLPVEKFPPLIAAVREPQFSIRKEGYTGGNGNFAAGTVSFGDYLPIFEYQLDNSSQLQFMIDGAMFAIYNLDKPSYDLFNTDYHFGLSLAYIYDRFSTRFRLYHVSSHLGDEFVMENPDIQRKNSSFEEAQLTLAYSLDHWRFYFGGGAIFRSNSLNDLDPLSVKNGAEYRRPLSPKVDFLTAVDLSISQRTEWKLTRSVMLGLSILKNETKDVRLMASYYGGNSPQGQFFEERIEYLGFGIYFII